MPLNQLIRYPDIVPLIPGTGVQFLDFGFRIEKNTPVPQEWGVQDGKAQGVVVRGAVNSETEAVSAAG